MNLSVEVISDVICPWCFIGKRRLEKAIAAIQGEHEVEVNWLPYQLNPTMPPEGISRREYRIKKFGSWERSQELDANVAENGKTEGIDFALNRIERTPNTVDAHRLIWLAGQQGCQNSVVEALFLGYFTLGKDLSNRLILIDVATEAGLSRQLAEELLDGDGGISEMAESKILATELGVDGVPFFIINRKVALAGAQPPEIFLEAFRQAESS